MTEVTVLCCYNDVNAFESFKTDLGKQSISIDLIGIDNSNNIYKSCASVFNQFLKQVNTKYVIFSHQDIHLKSPNDILTFLNYLKRVNVNDIVGVAGRRSVDGQVLTNISHGDKMKKAGNINAFDLEKCDTVDECFFGGTTECFKKYPFNEELCNDWHLYSVERCLSAISRGNSVYTCNIPLIHYSSGKMNLLYNKQLYNLCKFYSDKIDYICTTCASTRTKFPIREINYIIRMISILFGRY